MKKRTAVFISGRGSNLQALIDAAKASDYPAEIALVIANRDDAYGLRRAEAAGIATKIILHKDFPTRNAFDAALHDACVAYEIEFICLAGFMRVLTAEFVAKWKGRMINIHPSLLPAYPGLNTHARAIAAGEKKSGCTVHFVEADVDTGPIILQAEVPVMADDTAETLAARVLEQEVAIYPKALRLLAEGKIRAV